MSWLRGLGELLLALEKLKNIRDEVLREVKITEDGDYVYIVNPNHFEVTIYMKSEEARQIANFIKTLLRKG